ncbi:hypothetical protein [Brazilian marseillevirus]|uniref:hypothetical protein n=1 Tax=Brazilian marseillevirus TaxID=1813599 RepID=UPI0007819A5F|nr:hypothetical protein A3303_gp039 [Brazilian marseillevirus]AMQ10547.1 hypothetical protein [Brazilian marseillevirus]
MSSTSNSVIKREFVVSRNLVVPILKDASAATISTPGSIAFDDATQTLVASGGTSWSAPTASAATPTVRGTVLGTTPNVSNATVGIGNGIGSGTGTNTFLGIRTGTGNGSGQTSLTAIGESAMMNAQNVLNKTVVGKNSGIASNTGANSTCVGHSAMSSMAVGSSNSCAVGTQAQQATTGSGNCSIGDSTMTPDPTSNSNNSIAIGHSRLTTAIETTATNVINIGSGTAWSPGAAGSTGVTFIGNGGTLTNNTTGTFALGSGGFTGTTPAQTFAVSDNITQWRSLGLAVSASANVLQFDPVTGLITQAASSKRFKENIREEDFSSDILDLKVCSYEIGGKTDHGVIAEEVPETFATFDKDGQRNGVKHLLFTMAILSEIQKLRETVKMLREQRSM